MGHDVRRGVVAANGDEALAAHQAQVGLGRCEVLRVGGHLDAFGLNVGGVARQIATAGFVEDLPMTRSACS